MEERDKKEKDLNSEILCLVNLLPACLLAIGPLHILELDSNYRPGENEECRGRDMQKINFLLKGKPL